jgi:hypothetical protein
VSDSLVEVTQHMVNLLEEATQLGFEDVFYGDQEMIPRTPAIAVEPIGMTREASGIRTGGGTLNTFTIHSYVYHCPIQSPQVTRRESDQLAEEVQRIYHADVTLGGLVVHGYCTNSESGVAVRGGEMLRVHRITWMGISKTGLQP